MGPEAGQHERPEAVLSISIYQHPRAEIPTELRASLERFAGELGEFDDLVQTGIAWPLPWPWPWPGMPKCPRANHWEYRDRRDDASLEPSGSEGAQAFLDPPPDVAIQIYESPDADIPPELRSALDEFAARLAAIRALDADTHPGDPDPVDPGDDDGPTPVPGSSPKCPRAKLFRWPPEGPG